MTSLNKIFPHLAGNNSANKHFIISPLTPTIVCKSNSKHDKLPGHGYICLCMLLRKGIPYLHKLFIKSLDIILYSLLNRYFLFHSFQSLIEFPEITQQAKCY